MRSSGRNNPCPICGRVKDGDCRWNDGGLVLCHTIRSGVVAAGERHPDRPYIYCGESDEAQGFGKWLPEHLADDRPQKLKREPKESLFTYWFWDGTEAPYSGEGLITPIIDRKMSDGLEPSTVAQKPRYSPIYGRNQQPAWQPMEVCSSLSVES